MVARRTAEIQNGG